MLLPITLLITTVAVSGNILTLPSVLKLVVNSTADTLERTLLSPLNFRGPELDAAFTELLALEKSLKDDPLAKDEDVNLNVTQLITKYGYKCEVHYVETSDGYILTMFRIPSKGPPVLFMHGLLSSTDDWVTAGPKVAHPYVLADAGYDVWLGNARGTKHSKNHVSLSSATNNLPYWNFSWHEIGIYDIPAKIDYILKTTGWSKLTYIGHSQGNAAFLVMGSERPEYNEKISKMIGLAPVAYFSHASSALFRLLFDINAFNFLASINIYEILPDSTLTKIICVDFALTKFVCSNLLFALFGFGRGYSNFNNLPVNFAHFPSGVSGKQFEHFRQIFYSGTFSKYNYGKKKNLEVYGTKSPPEYSLGNVTAPVAYIYSDSDILCNNTDVEITKSKLKNLVYSQLYKGMNHADFLWAKDLKNLLGNTILQLIKN